MPGIHSELVSTNKSILAKSMLIRSTLELAEASQSKYLHYKTARLFTYRGLQGTLRKDRSRMHAGADGCSISNNWQIEADINLILGAHLEPEKYIDLGNKRTISSISKDLNHSKKIQRLKSISNYSSSTDISTSAAKTVNIADEKAFNNQSIFIDHGMTKHGLEHRTKSTRNGTPA